MSDVKINVEYCGSCGHRKQFLEMADAIRKDVPTAEVSGSEGRQASFEVQVNGELVYSKLQTMAFPDYEAVAELAKEVSQGEPVRKIKKEQPIDCAIS
ncbi:migration and invasion enhancer 1 [Diprion similis]|uniref:migration and invasion enhancer 1 n=1 Tax=Diprion similis TaxID=362088 RepID=UPI001EF985B0|nr:migration and invasion enhancer 1 [Diprion similis]